MTQSVEFRLPGVYFLPRQPVPGLRLPRLDVAAFVGFAERGPLDLPVPLEDYSAYQNIFGGDLPLAQEAAPVSQGVGELAMAGSPPSMTASAGAGERLVIAHLPRAVYAFFANGGRRCYVVRVAGKNAEAARFRLPGLLALGGPKLAGISASSSGAWGAELRLAARLAVTPLPPGLFAWAPADGGPALSVDPSVLRQGGLFTGGTAPLQPGDVLRIALADGTRLLAVVAALEGNSLLRLANTRSLVPFSGPVNVQRMDLLTTGDAVPLLTSGTGSASAQGLSLRLAADDFKQLGPGDVLRLAVEAPAAGAGSSLPCLARIASTRAARGLSGSPAEITYEAVLTGFLGLEEVPPAALSAALVSIELLRMDLLVRLGSRRLPAITDLAFNAGIQPGQPDQRHPRFWGDALLLATAFPGSAPAYSGAAARRRGAGGRALPAPFAAAADLFRGLFNDPYNLRPAASGLPRAEASDPEDPRFWKTLNRGFSPLSALSGLLAPAGSGLSLARAQAETDPEYLAAEEELAQAYLPVNMPEIFDEADSAQFLPPEAGRGGSDDLLTFEPSVFYDPRLAPPGSAGLEGIGETYRSLPATAADLRYTAGRRLRGMHSLMFVEEAALISIPDAAHQPWQPVPQLPEPAPPKPPLPAVPDCPAGGDFLACGMAPVALEVEPYYGPLNARTPVLVHGQGFSSTRGMRLLFGTRPAEGLSVVSSTLLSAMAPAGLRSGPVDVSIEAAEPGGVTASSTLPGGFNYTSPECPGCPAQGLPRVISPGPNDLPQDAPILQVHHALSVLCQARGDLVAILNLPQAYDRSLCLDWQAELRSLLRLPQLDEELANDEPLDIADLSFMAVYHPWLRLFDPAAPSHSRAIPPDGAVCGLIAAREHERFAWVAPANRPLAGAVGLAGSFSDDDWAELFAHQINLVRPEARGFAPMSAHTLSGASSLMQLSVRRLLILLKKAALNVGMDFAFASNSAVFRQGVGVALEGLLSFLFEYGAFAGNSKEEAFNVVTGDSVNPPDSVELGRFVALVQVAPSQPMEFITVQLTRTDEGGVTAIES